MTEKPTFADLDRLLLTCCEAYFDYGDSAGRIGKNAYNTRSKALTAGNASDALKTALRTLTKETTNGGDH